MKGPEDDAGLAVGGRAFFELAAELDHAVALAEGDAVTEESNS